MLGDELFCPEAGVLIPTHTKEKKRHSGRYRNAIERSEQVCDQRALMKRLRFLPMNFYFFLLKHRDKFICQTSREPAKTLRLMSAQL